MIIAAETDGLFQGNIKNNCNTVEKAFQNVLKSNRNLKKWWILQKSGEILLHNNCNGMYGTESEVDQVYY